MRFLFAASLIFFVLHFEAVAQVKISGSVQSAESKLALPNASVFFSNTSFGTVTDGNGNFSLTTASFGRFELVVSCIGFETYLQTIQLDNKDIALTIQLKPKAVDLGNLVLEPLEVNGWEKWGNFFSECFIGLTPFSKECTIKNTDILKFRHSKKEKKLWVYANEELVIENKALGYLLKYKLETFEYDFANNMIVFVGYPFFQEIKTERRGLQKRWIENRMEAYWGSIMHFMRSVYRNSITAEGFEMRRLQKKLNPEKQRIKQLVAKRNGALINANGAIIVNGLNIDTTPLHPDTLTYFKEVMKQKDIVETLDTTLLSGDSIAYAIDSFTAAIQFTDYLHIIYKNKQEPLAYSMAMGRGNQRQPFCVSELIIRDADPIQIQSNGSYFDPTKLLSIGFWSWSEKVGNMLPFNYKPPKTKAP